MKKGTPGGVPFYYVGLLPQYRIGQVCTNKYNLPVTSWLPALAGLDHCSGDDSHLVDLVCVAAAGQVVDGSSQTLQDGAVSLETAQTLSDLVADIAGLDGGEDEGIGVACNRGAGELQLTDLRSNSCVEQIGRASCRERV